MEHRLRRALHFGDQFLPLGRWLLKYLSNKRIHLGDFRSQIIDELKLRHRERFEIDTRRSREPIERIERSPPICLLLFSRLLILLIVKRNYAGDKTDAGTDACL